MTILSTLRNSINRGVSSTINAARSAASSTANFIRNSIAQTAGYARDTATGSYNRFANTFSALRQAPRERLAPAQRSNLGQAPERGTDRFANTREALNRAADEQPANRFAPVYNQLRENHQREHRFGPAPNGFEVVHNLAESDYVEFLDDQGNITTRESNNFFQREGDPNNEIHVTMNSREDLEELVKDDNIQRRFLRALPQSSRGQSDTGGFFPLFLKPDVQIKPKINSGISYDLTKYGIFTEKQWDLADQRPEKSNCMILALKNHVAEEILERICFNRVTRLAEIPKICERVNMGIDVKGYKNWDGKPDTNKYGTPEQRANKVIKLGIFLGHFFENEILEEIKYSTIKKCLWRGKRKAPKRDNGIDVLTLLRLMYENKDEYFTPHNSNIQSDCNFTTFTDFKGKFLTNEDSQEKKERKVKESNTPITSNQMIREDSNSDSEANSGASREANSGASREANSGASREANSDAIGDEDSDENSGEEVRKYIIDEDENGEDLDEEVDEDLEPFKYDATYFADFETTTDGDRHVPYLLSVLNEKKDMENPYLSEGKLKKFLKRKKVEYEMKLGNCSIDKKFLKLALKIEEKKARIHQNGKWDDYETKVFTCFDLKEDNKGNLKPINMTKEMLDYMANKFFDRHDDAKRTGKKIKIQVLMHNLGYDAKFILQDLVFIAGRPNVLQKSRSNFVSVKIYYSNVVFNFVDSYGKIPSKLDDFAVMFGLEQGKFKKFPYHKYTSESIRFSNMIIYEDEWEKEEYWKPIHDKKDYYKIHKTATGSNVYIVDRWKYAIDYCNQDNLTLRNGYLIFKIWIEVLFGTDINYDTILTIGSLSMAVQKKWGVFDGVYEFTGKTGAFLQEAVIGGRVMTGLHITEDGSYVKGPQILNYNEEEHGKESFDKKNYIDFDKKSLTDKSLNYEISRKNKKKNKTKINYKEERGKYLYDIDKVSLYPAAMIQMPGYVTGKPTQITTKRLESRKFMQSNYYVVQIKITKVGRKLRFPLLSRKFTKEDEKILGENCAGNRNWTNDMEGRTVIVDRYILEDCIKYHQIEWEPILGLEFFGEFNPNINKIMSHLFNIRKFFKKIENPAQELFKLLMNSGFGKTIERPKYLERVFVPLKTPKGKPRDLKWIHQKYSGCLESSVGYGIYNLITYRKSIIQHYNRPHCGGAVLSWSKRIMQEIMDPIDEYIYYTDTDSIFVEKEGYDKILKLRPELIGKDIHQFHNDIDIDALDSVIINCQCLIPKCYYYKATGYETIKNEKTGKKERTYNMVFKDIAKIKAIPKATINAKIEEDFRGNTKDLFNAIRHWEEGVTFNLAKPRVRFLHKANGDIETVNDFTRCVRA